MLKITFLLALLLFHSSAYAKPASSPTLAEARTLVEQGRDADAIASLQQMVGQKPAHFQAWFLLGVTQARQRRFHDAIDAFNRVIALQPKLAEPHNNLAVIYNELGDFRAAVKELEASLKLKPDYTTAQENIGDLYVKLAADAYRKALAHDAHPDLQQRYERLLHIRDARQPQQSESTHQEKAPPIADNQPALTLPALHQQPPAAEKTIAVAATTETGAKTEAEAKKHAAAVAMPSTHTADATKPALAALEAWRSAWNRQDVAAYFAAYSPAFDFGTRFKTLAQWKHYKQWAITKRAFIRVTLENIEATPLPGSVIRLIFLQHFRSESYSSDDIKQLILRKTQDGWKIIREISK